jgi:hypothetical protein
MRANDGRRQATHANDNRVRRGIVQLASIASAALP